MKTAVFFDLDDTLYDTGKMFRPICEDMISLGHSRERVTSTAIALIDEGYSFEAHLLRLGVPMIRVIQKAKEYYAAMDRGSDYLYPDVVPVLQCLHEKRVTLHLLTFGFPTFQRRKFFALHPDVTQKFASLAFVWKQETKGLVLRRHVAAHPSHRTIFVDDSVRHLWDAERNSPDTARVHIWRSTATRPVTPKSWLRIRSVSELLEHIDT